MILAQADSENMEAPDAKPKDHEDKSAADGQQRKKNGRFPEGKHYGVIAQEIEKVLPELVKEGAEGDKAVAYTELIPVLMKV